MPGPFNLVEDLSPDFWTGSKEVGAAIVQLFAAGLPVQKGVQIKADATNAGTVYVGKSNVTPASADVTDGFPLAAGEGIFVPVKDITKIYMIASQASQEIYWMAV